MEFLLAQGITETVEVKVEPQVEQVEPQKNTEDPVGGGVKEEITVPIPTPPVEGLDDSLIDKILMDSVPLMRPIPRLPMGTITETITIPATVPTYNNKQSTTKKMFPQGEVKQIKTEPNGTITIKREICDGEVHLGPFKSCLKEFTGVPAVGWIAAAAGLIVLWKWLDYKFRK